MTHKNATPSTTEIEAKFTIPDYATFVALKTTTRLGDFRLKPLGARTISDCYLDAADQPLLQAGFACRLRKTGQGQILTLKSLTPPEENVHRRQEIEMEVEAVQPKAWPHGQAKDLVLQIVGQASLETLFTIYQTRHKYHVLLKKQPVLELSLDEVSHSKPDQIDYFELEAELIESGTEADLLDFIDTLQSHWGLQAETQSKFERALAAQWGEKKEESRPAQLSDAEQSTLEIIASSANELVAKRATIILMSQSGIDPADISHQVALTPRTVKQWQKKFEEKRLAIFPDNVLLDVAASIAAESERSRVSIEAKSKPREPKISKKAKRKKRKKATVKYKQKKIGLKPTDTVAEAGRKVLGHHFAQMLKYEAGTRLGENIEDLHVMRVATRRMRAAFKVFEQGFSRKAVKPLLKGLKETARALGPMRDLDVFMEKLHHYQQSLPESESADLQPLLDIWQAKRDKTRQKMLTYLDSQRYLKFKQNFLKFVKTKDMGAKPIPTRLPPVPYQLRHIVPGLIYTYYEEVRAYETILETAPIETLHQLRISFKGLRYTLEYLYEVLGDEKDGLIEEVKTMQDHLGRMNDADVAVAMLQDFLSDWEKNQLHLPLAERQSPTQIVNYLNENLNERHQQLVSFPEAWAKFNRLEVRQKLAQAISIL